MSAKLKLEGLTYDELIYAAGGLFERQVEGEDEYSRRALDVIFTIYEAAAGKLVTKRIIDIEPFQLLAEAAENNQALAEVAGDELYTSSYENQSKHYKRIISALGSESIEAIKVRPTKPIYLSFDQADR